MTSPPEVPPVEPASEGEFLNGRLLIAMPGISDPRFERAVILVCLHAPEQAMGVRINDPHEEMTLDSILEKLGIDGGARESRQLVLKGGPVERDRGYVLHSDDYMSESSIPVSDDICLTATLDIVLVRIADGLERRTWRQLDLFVRLLEPLMLLILALVVLLLAVALLLPVIRMSTAI